MGSWTVAEAKARLSQLIEQERSKGPQTITRRGRAEAVVVAVEEWDRKDQAQGQPRGVLRHFAAEGFGHRNQAPQGSFAKG
jgi:prevent-host-death family protein